MIATHEQTCFEAYRARRDSTGRWNLLRQGMRNTVRAQELPSLHNLAEPPLQLRADCIFQGGLIQVGVLQNGG